MPTGIRYRVLSVAGAVAVIAASLLFANAQTIQSVSTSLIPVFNRLSPTILTGQQLQIALFVSGGLLLASLLPLFKPRPRRFLDIILLTQGRVLVGGLALATIGYFDYTYRLPRPTLVLTISTLLVVLPLWFVLIRRSPREGEERAIIIGDEYDQIEDILAETEATVVGYVSPPNPWDSAQSKQRLTADGGTEASTIDSLRHLGGLSRLSGLLVRHDIDTAYFALRASDRGEFFGALKTCYDHGVAVKAHRNHIDSVLFDAEEGKEIVDVDLEPWDWQEYMFKRLFDVAFAASALVITAPLIALISVAIKLDSPGPVLYSQERTAELGDTFHIYKFRSMLPESEDARPSDDDNDRITRVGRLLRRTHLDEIPQLWSIFTGEMSVVGPRAAWVDEEQLLQAETSMWQKRWFVKPGLTGLAQINNVSSTNPEEKLRYDLAYIRRQSFVLDIKIVIRQLWMVLIDIVEIVQKTISDE